MKTFKKITSIILLIIQTLLVVWLCLGTVTACIDIKNEAEYLASINASGVDYLGVSFGAAMVVFVCCVSTFFGTIISIINIKIAQIKPIKYLSYGFTAFYSVFLAISLVVFITKAYMRF